jgi:hypothetical protein
VTALWAFAPDDVWAGGQTMLHFDGTTFAPVPTPLGFVADFWGFAPDDLFAVAGTSLLHWNGTAWSTVDFAGAIDPTDLQAIWGTSDNDLWLGDTLNGRVFRWNGTAWSTTITQAVNVTDLWGSSDTDVYAGGTFGLSHWNGSSWTEVSDPLVAGVDGLWGFGPADVWAVGTFTTLAHFDGSVWTDTVPANDNNFIPEHLSVWGAAPDDVWAVGDAGAISRWDGARWSQIQVGTFPYFPFLAKVHGSSAADVWVAGRSADGKNAGVILHHGP